MRLPRFIKISLVFLNALLMTTAAWAIPTFNLTEGVTPVSRDIYDLHMTIFWICVVIGILVFGVLIFTLIRHRKSRGVKPAEFHEHTRLEILWAIIPLVILVIMAVPATRILMRMNDDTDADINIKVTGYQWKWQYEYLDEGISFFSNLSTPLQEIQNKTGKNQWYLLEVDKPLVVPIHKKIRFLVTSNDVIHSWWVPALGIKRDAMPGFVHEAWARIEKPGIYRGQCAELCGVNHAYMPIVVKAVPEAEYEQWIAQQTKANPPQTKPQAQAGLQRPWTKAELMQHGEEVYNSNCAVCHMVNGEGRPPMYPSLKGSKVATGPVNNHISIVINGRPGTPMPAFGRGAHPMLDDSDIAAVVTYERNAWGNDVLRQKKKVGGDLVQPSEVTALKQKTATATTQK